jgi:hypothetical protein
MAARLRIAVRKALKFLFRRKANTMKDKGFAIQRILAVTEKWAKNCPLSGRSYLSREINAHR